MQAFDDRSDGLNAAALPKTGVGSAGVSHILVVDDHAVVRLGLLQLLRQLAPAAELSEAANLGETEAVLAARADVGLVVLDLHLPDVPDGTPLLGLRRLRQAYPLLAVALMSADNETALAAQALREGAAGWLPKTADPRLLASALSLVLQGGCFVPAFLLQRPPATTETLSERQLDVLRQLIAGVSNKEIARALGLAEPTVKAHLVSIFRVLRVRNRAQAVVAGRSHLRALGGW